MTAEFPSAGGRADQHRALALVAELRAELEGLCPPAMREPRESATLDMLTPSSISPVLSSAAMDPATAGIALGNVLAGATAMLRRLGAPAREASAAAAAASLGESLAAVAASAAASAAAGDASAAAAEMSKAVTRSLRFLFGELRQLQHDAGNAALASLAPLARGGGGVRWARDRFAARHGLVVPPYTSSPSASSPTVIESLPRTAAWLAAAVSHVHALDAQLPALVTAKRIDVAAASPLERRVERGANKEAAGSGISAESVPNMQTGRNVQSDARSASPERDAAKEVEGDKARVAAAWRPVPVCTPEGMLRVAVASLVAEPSAVSPEMLPETLEFDDGRLTALQNEFQRIRVLAACLVIGQKRNVAGEQMKTVRRRVEALLGDPEIRLPDIALEVATHVHAAASSSSASSSPSSSASSVSSVLAAVDPELRSLTSHGDEKGRALSEALLGALRARLLVGLNIAPSAAAAAAEAAASAVSMHLAKVGFAGSTGVGLVGDVARLAGEAMRTIVRVTNLVHSDFYDVICRDLLAEEDEI